jgi:hypothetical protein
VSRFELHEAGARWAWRGQDEGRLSIHDYRVHALGDKKEKARK